MPSLSDSHARQLALDTTRSFVVTAPAGSGKTGLLTQRMLALLARCEQPENILAITFTNKAATEMQERLFAALQQAQSQTQAPEDSFAKTTWTLARAVLAQNTRLQWDLFATPKRLRITTIDSFCRQISQQTPLSNGLGNTPAVLENPDMAYTLAARETLSLLEKNQPLQHDLITLVKHFDNRLSSIEQLFVRMLSKRDQWLPILYTSKNKRQSLELTLAEVITTQLTQVRSQLAPIAGELSALADYAANNLQQNPADRPKNTAITDCLGATDLPPSHPDCLQAWLGITELLLSQNGRVRKRVDKRLGFPTAAKTLTVEEQQRRKQHKETLLTLLQYVEDRPLLAQNLQAIRRLPTPRYSDAQWQLLDSLSNILTMLTAQLHLVFQQLGETDYIEINLAALNALGNHQNDVSDLALLLDYRLQHILVDEFQDTSATQLALLKQLTRGWQADDGRTLFLVGDAMQSCYSFRNANVGIFLDIRQHGLGDIAITPLDLTVNFRSQENIVSWLNQVFYAVFPKENNSDQGAVRYHQAVAIKPPSDQANISMHLFTHQQSHTARTAEADKISDIIKHHRRHHAKGSIAILVRSRHQVAAITQVLNREALSYSARDIDNLADTRVIQDLLSLSRALLYPNDRIAWLSLLRSPWCGLDMHDLHSLANHNKTGTTWPLLLSNILASADIVHLSPKGKKRLQNFAHTLDTIYQQQQRSGLQQWILSAWVALGGPASLLHEEEIASANRFFSLLDKHDQGGRIRQWEAFHHALNTLFSPARTTDTASEYPPVEILTIHKSKGLEFDTVIIPGIDRSLPPDSLQLIEWLEQVKPESVKLLISPVHATGNERDKIYDYIRQVKRDKQRYEADRVFYVGCTRATTSLHLLAYNQQDAETVAAIDKGSIDADALVLTGDHSFLHRIWPLVKQSAHLYADIDAHTPADQDSRPQHPSNILRLASDWQAPDYPANHLLKAYRLHNYHEQLDNQDNMATTEALMQRHSRYLGIVLHQALQQITESGCACWSPEKIYRQQAFWQTQLRQLGTPAPQLQAACTKIAQALIKMLQTPTGRWLLDNSHEASACELSLWSTVATDAHTKGTQSIIDRTFITTTDRGKERWIIDYKSSEPSTEQTHAMFFQQEITLYRAQLLRYRQLFEAEDTTLRTALYFPLLAQLQEITSD
ncbi:MAG: UvrD-helicase domain-containing protein [Cellvibrionaceae bacterium]|nr:UvrD-helicase domain-containing protein [Cellvibrionaceae bacterium]